MSACRFDFDFRGESSVLVETIRTRMSAAGGTFTGSSSEGSFHLSTPMGDLEGSYSVVGQTITVEVSKKPFIVPCSAIETKLRDFVLKAG